MLRMYYSTLLNSFVKDELPETKREALAPVYSSILNQFLDYYGLSSTTPVGEELYNVENLGLYFEHLEGKYSAGTIPGIKSKLKKIRNYALKLGYTHDIKELQFGESLEHILGSKNISREELADFLNIHYNTMAKWIAGKSLPSYMHLELVDKIEEYLEVPKGILKSKLGRVAHGEKRKLFNARKRTEHGKKNQELSEKSYKLPFDQFSEKVKRDINIMISFFTSDFPKMVHPGFKRAKRQQWTVKPGKKESGKAKMVIKDIEQFFGFLVAPTDHEDPMLAGLGIPVDKLSLACLVNADFINRYIQFRLSRMEKLTTGSKRILDQLKVFCRKKYGYIRQHIILGQEYFIIQDGDYIYPYETCEKGEWNELWDQICDNTHEYLEDVVESSTFSTGVDTFKPVEKIVEADILPQIKEIVRWVRHDAGLKGRGKVMTAIKQRDSLLTKLIFLFELRIDHYATMEFGRHIFEQNGKMVLRIYREELKRPEILKSPYVTLVIPDDVRKEIKTYRDVYRPFLYGADDSKKVFLGSPSGRKTEKSVDGVEGRSLSYAFRQLMYLYSNSDTGFGPHAVRKIVTSVLDRKRDIGDFDRAATLAMHTTRVSRESYAAHQVEAAFNHYVSRLQRAGVLEMPKGERRKIEVDEIEYYDMLLRNKELEQRLIGALEKLKVAGQNEEDDLVSSAS